MCPAKPAASAQIMPKPRAFMKSLNSCPFQTFSSAAVSACAIGAGRFSGAAMPRQAPTL